MEFFEKTVNYFKLFEDIKLFEPDYINEKLAIVFYGKENMIHLFDLNKYTQWYPFHIVQKEKTIEDECNGSNEKMALLSQSQNLSENSASLNFPVNLNLTTSQNEYNSLINIFKDINPDKNFEPLFNTPDKKTKQEKAFYNSSDLKKTLTDEFCFYPEKEEFQISLKLKKPEVKSKILGIILQDLLSIMGLKWFDFSLSANKTAERLLMSLTEDGLIYFHRLKKKNLGQQAQVEINKLSTNPFSNLEEEWTRIAYFSNEKPIKDFWLSEKNYNLYILNIDNNINFYEIEESKKPSIGYRKKLCFNLFPGQNLNKFTLSSDEGQIFGFFDECFRVYKNSQPFHRLYSFSYKDFEYLNKFRNYLKPEEKSDESNINGNYIYDQNIKDDYCYELNKLIKANNKNKTSKVKAGMKPKDKATKNDNNSIAKGDTKANNFNNKKLNKSTNGNSRADKNAKINKKQIKNKARKHLNDSADEEIESEENENSDFIDLEEADEFTESEDDLEEMFDFIDFNEKMGIQDNNFILNNVQKGLVSLDKKFVLFTFFSNQTYKFYLVKFHLQFFNRKITEYEFFKKCHNGQMPQLCQIVICSYEKIFFNFPPALYLKNNIFRENEFLDFANILKFKLNLSDIENNIYCPLAVINKEVLYFVELNQNFNATTDDSDIEKNHEIKNCYDKLLDKYAFTAKDPYCYEGLSFKWLYNNTLLITAEDKLMRMIKFTYDQFVLGLLVKKDYSTN